MSVERGEAGTGASEPKLPQGWAWATVGEILVRSDSGKSFKCEPRPATTDEWGIIKVSAMTWGEFQESENKALLDESLVNSAYEIRVGDILVSRANTVDHVGAPVLVEEVRPRLLLSDKSLRFMPGSAVDRNWFVYWLRSPAVRRAIEGKASGTSDSMRNISQSDLRAISIPVPPADEQGRIAAALNNRLTRLEQIEARLVATQQHLERLGNMVMAAAATGVLASDAEPQHAPIDSSSAVVDGELPPLPTGWHWARLQDIANVVGGVTKDSKSQDDSDLPEVPYLRVANAQRAQLDLSRVTKIRVSPKALEKLRLRNGDLLMTEGGDRNKLGRGWIWEDQIQQCIHQNHLFRARILEHATHPKLLGWYVNSVARSWFEANGKQSVNLASISISKVKLLPVPVPPTDQEEQQDFVALGERVLSRFRRLATACEQGLAHTAALRRSLLTAAFAGRLVSQDSQDEPAEDLLKRVRAEREAAEAERKAARRAAVQAKRKKQQSAAKLSTAAPPPRPAAHTPLPEGEQTTLPLEFTE
ncbi:restriction endonuclease subunit S [Streptomyces malaysiensis]|uniref:restriction endonuclease subunit S n=1 Tax=Streptomyces malaysiensis TaxID=92644 RepID=UPI0036CC5CA1